MTTIGEQIQLIRGVRIPGPTAALLPEDGEYDILIEDGHVVDIAPTGNIPATGAVLEGMGQWAIPGLWDHHIHSSPWALRASRTSLLQANTAEEAAVIAGEIEPNAAGLRIGIEFRDGLWPSAPTLAVLDERTGDVPTYLVSSDLHCMWLNTAALKREGLPLVDEGVLREEQAFAVAKQLDVIGEEPLDTAIDLAAREAAARGVVGVVDLNMAWNASEWQRRIAAGFDALRVRFGIYPSDLDRAIAEGLETGEALDEAGLVTVGGVKVITDGSLGTRTAACKHSYGDSETTGVLSVEPDELEDVLMRATGAGLSVYVHAIGDQAVSNALDAFAKTGAIGTIEHAQLVAHADVQRIVRLEVTASLQPTHAVDDRDLAEQEWQDAQSMIYPQRSLFEAGANVVFGSDAPVASLDPWATIANAVSRTADARAGWRATETVTNAQALAASTSTGSLGGVDLSPGAVADIALCASNPYVATAEELRGMKVGATLIGGRVTHITAPSA